MIRKPLFPSFIRHIQHSSFARILPWVVCALAALFYFYELCLRVALGTMVPEVAASLTLLPWQIGMLSTFYYYSYTPMQIVAGALLDRWGARVLLTTMVLLCAAGAFMFAYTPYFWLALLAQLVIGFASAFAFVGVLKLATIWLPLRYFSFISGLTTALGMIGAMLSNIIIAMVMGRAGWRGVWAWFGYFGIFLMVVFLALCIDGPESSSVKKAAGRPRMVHWSDIRADFMLMVRSTYFWVNAVIGGLLYFPTTSFASLWGIPYLQIAHHFDKLTASTIVSMIFFGWAIGGPVAGWLSHEFIEKKTMLLWGGVVALGLITVILYGHIDNIYGLSVLFMLFGVFSSVEVLVFDVAARLFQNRSAGTAASMTNFILMLVCTILQPVIGIFLPKNGTVHDYQSILAILPLGLAIAVVMVCFFYKEKKPNEAE